MRRFWVSLLVAVLTVLCSATVFAVTMSVLSRLFGDTEESWSVILSQSLFQGLIFGVVMYLFFLISNHRKNGKNSRKS